MMPKVTEHSMFMPVSEIECMLDRLIDGLARMDAQLLVQLARLCGEWETKKFRLAISDAMRARLSWKLLLLDRLLRQTRVNLNILGLEPRQYLPGDGYKSLKRI